MHRIFLLVFALLGFMPASAVVDPIDKVAALIKADDMQGLTAWFAESVEVSILNDENVYSKAQAGLILDKFFTEHKPSSVKLIHKVNSNPSYRFGVVLVNTDKGSYRITFTLKGTGPHPALIELRVEAAH